MPALRRGPMNINIVERLTAVDLFARDRDGRWLTGTYVGRPFDLTFGSARFSPATLGRTMRGGCLKAASS